MNTFAENWWEDVGTDVPSWPLWHQFSVALRHTPLFIVRSRSTYIESDSVSVCMHNVRCFRWLKAFYFYRTLRANTSSKTIVVGAPLIGSRQAIDVFSNHNRRLAHPMCVRMICETATSVLYENAQWIINGNNWIALLAWEKPLLFVSRSHSFR